jgi:hypothetical protein
MGINNVLYNRTGLNKNLYYFASRVKKEIEHHLPQSLIVQQVGLQPPMA